METNVVKVVLKSLLILVGVCIVFLSWWHIVPPGHRGVAVTLGSVQKDIRAEGITFKLPFFTTINNIEIKQNTWKSKASCFSSDLQTVIVSYAVLFRIPENRAVELFQQYGGDIYQSLVEPRIQEVLKQETALFKAEELVKSREKIKIAVLKKMCDLLGGIENNGGLLIINDVVLENIDLTDELEKAIEQKQVMEQQAFAKSYELQKEQKEAEITVVRATAEAQSVKIKGEALKASPEVIQLELVKKWDGKAPSVVSTMAGGANILLPMK